MEFFVELSKIVLYISLSILCIFSIFYLKRIVNSISKIEENIASIQNKLNPVLDNVHSITNKIDTFIDSMLVQIKIVQESFHNLKTVIDDIKEFEQNLKHTIEKPIIAISNFISGIISGLSGFFNSKKEE